MIEWFKSWFRKDAPFYHTPSVYGSVEYSDQARKLGVFEDATKEFKIIEGNKIVKIFRYSEVLVESYQEKYNLPVIDMTEMEEEDLPIHSVDRPGVIDDD